MRAARGSLPAALQVGSDPFKWIQACAWGDEVVFDSGGPPRERKGAPFGWGMAPHSGDVLDLCK